MAMTDAQRVMSEVYDAPVVDLDADLMSVYRRLSLRAGVAQSGEQSPLKGKVAGSIPAARTKDVEFDSCGYPRSLASVAQG